MKKSENFNYGAAVFGLLWVIKMGVLKDYLPYFITWIIKIPIIVFVIVAILIAFIPHAPTAFYLEIYWLFFGFIIILPITYIILSIISGVYGNSWILNNKKDENCTLTQEKWNKYAKIVLILLICLLMLCIFYTKYIIPAKYHKEAEQKYLQAAECKVLISSYDNLFTQHGNKFSLQEYSDNLSNRKEVKQLFVEFQNNERVNMSMLINNNPAYIKIKKDNICKLQDENCYIYNKYSSCWFYFDDFGKIKLSDYTKNSIKK